MNDQCKLFVFLCLGVVETQLCDADVILGAAAEFCNHADQSEGGNVAEYSTITDRLVWENFYKLSFLFVTLHSLNLLNSIMITYVFVFLICILSTDTIMLFIRITKPDIYYYLPYLILSL